MKIQWLYTKKLVTYPVALRAMKARVYQIRNNDAPGLIWGLQHPSLYTAGTSSCDQELLKNDMFPIYQTGRGGKYTYHGPGQLVIYVMLDLGKYRCDIRWFIQLLESWGRDVLEEIGLSTFVSQGHPGIWCREKDSYKKIMSIGIRVSRWVTWHGLALNVCTDLENFSGIVPCGLTGSGLTSLAELGVKKDCFEVWELFRKKFPL